MPKKKIDATQRMHLWLETGDGMFMGLGRVQLLERIDRFGSLNKAAASMGMSYRAAWGRIKKTEESMGRALVTKTGPKKEYRLNDFGRDLAQKFRAWQADVESHALTSARKLFPWNIAAFEDDDAPLGDQVEDPETG